MPHNVLEELRARANAPRQRLFSRFLPSGEILPGSQMLDLGDVETVAPGAREAAATQIGDIEDEFARRTAETEAIRGAQRGAFMRGFESPQAEARFGREQERFKLEAPIREAQVKGAFDVEAAREGARALADRLGITQAGLSERAAASQAGQTARQGMTVPPSLITGRGGLNEARQALRGAETGIIPRFLRGVTGGFFQGTEDERERFGTALTAVLREMGSIDEITQLANLAATQGLSADDIVAGVRELGDALDPIEEEALRFFVEQARQ